MTDFRQDHPAKIGERALWFGTECEGRLTGRFAAFVACNLTPLERSRLAVRTSEVQVLFITETFDAWDFLRDQLLPWAYANKIDVVVARMADQMMHFAAMRLVHSWLNDVTVMVRVFDAPWIRHLGGNDQVSVGVPYEMRTFEVGKGVLTLPEHYEEDTL